MDKEKVHTDQKIKLLFRHRSMEMGGVEKVMLSLLNHLNKEKFQITVLLNLNQGELRDEIPDQVRKVFLAEGKEDFSKNFLIRKLQLFLRKRKLNKFRENPKIIDQQILKENFDIEIGMTYNDFEAVLNSTNKNSKKVGWFHSEIHLPKLQPLVPKILKHFPQFDYMVYCSKRIKDLMHEHYPNLDYPKESVIINAVPIEEIKRKAQLEGSGEMKKRSSIKPELAEVHAENFPEAKSESKIPQFISIGRLHSRKGYHKLMAAHAKLLQDGFAHSVLIIGDGEELPNLLEQRKKLGVEKTFVFAGNKMNPYPYLKNSDFFIMPSESEAWPLVIAEALILQKPIIATKVGDVETLIAHRKTGYLIPYETDEMYSAMKEFLTNGKLVSEIRENLVGIEKQFDNKKIFEEIEKIFFNLVQSKI